MLDARLLETLNRVAAFYDGRKVGEVGHLGFRRSTHLGALMGSLDLLLHEKVLVPGETRFLDMGCADGRVNVLLSYLVKASVGIEIDDWILEEYEPLKSALVEILLAEKFLFPPENIHLFLGDTLEERVHEKILQSTRLPFEAFDLFYTYLTMYQEFADLIAERARPGTHFLIYGLDLILPRLRGLTIVQDPRLLENKLALYRKD
jgi:SAM-dependent methyltransferase